MNTRIKQNTYQHSDLFGGECLVEEGHDLVVIVRKFDHLGLRGCFDLQHTLHIVLRDDGYRSA
jgi:hypothetical protein